jgi:hypothetical protein
MAAQSMGGHSFCTPETDAGVTGRSVWNGSSSTGEVLWNQCSSSGSAVPNGVYLIMVESENLDTYTSKVVVR